jgi:3-hydroxyisobutyrate dehydrogenase-like beta-hydroxyacid dehydrogenase
MQVGFAGLGRMGAHMARNLAHAGHDLSVWNRSSGKAYELAKQTGCTVAATPRELAQKAEVVLCMLADDAASRDVYLGPDGLFAAPTATIFVEMGTMSPAHIADLTAVAPNGVHVIDAPVSGATQAAEAGTLIIMAGCTETQAEHLAPVFAAIGSKTIYMGRSGAGSVMKLAVNSLIHGLNQTLAEAMTLAEAAGVAPTLAYDVIENSAAAAPMLKYRRALYLDEAAQDVAFTVALARKDMEVTAALARNLGVAMPQGDVTLKRLKMAEASGYADRDMAAILNFMREENQ